MIISDWILDLSSCLSSDEKLGNGVISPPVRLYRRYGIFSKAIGERPVAWLTKSRRPLRPITPAVADDDGIEFRFLEEVNV